MAWLSYEAPEPYIISRYDLRSFALKCSLGLAWFANGVTEPQSISKDDLGYLTLKYNLSPVGGPYSLFHHLINHKGWAYIGETHTDIYIYIYIKAHGFLINDVEIKSSPLEKNLIEE